MVAISSSKVNNWQELANEKNGQDNTSVVINVCRTSQAKLVPVPPAPIQLETTEVEESAITLAETETSELEAPQADALTDSSQALLELNLDDEDSETTVSKEPNRGKLLMILGAVMALLVSGTTLGLYMWWQLQPQSFNQVCRQLPSELKEFCPKP